MRFTLGKECSLCGIGRRLSTQHAPSLQGTQRLENRLVLKLKALSSLHPEAPHSPQDWVTVNLSPPFYHLYPLLAAFQHLCTVLQMQS